MMAPIKSPEAQLLIAIQNRQQDKIHELLEMQGVGANSANDRGVRPMHMACQIGDMSLVHRLLELGADIITADKAGNTPLHYAAKHGKTELVKVLVGQGAAVEQRNGYRQTAYDVATDHVIRQFLLPLQLKAEAGHPEYEVHSMGITSDVPRNYEQYGVPGIGMGPSQSHGQPAYGGGAHQYGGSSVGPDPMSAALGDGQSQSHGQPAYGGGAHQYGGSSVRPDPMSAALGALMQPAPSMASAPRRGVTAARAVPPPPSVVAGGAAGMLGGTPPRPAGCVSPPDGGLSFPPSMPSSSPTPPSTTPGVSPGLATPGVTVGSFPLNPRSGSLSPPPAAPFPGATPAGAGQTSGAGLARSAPSPPGGALPTVPGSSSMGDGATSPPAFTGVAVQVNHPAATREECASSAVGAPPLSSPTAGSPMPAADGGYAFEGDQSTSPEVDAGDAAKSSYPEGSVPATHQITVNEADEIVADQLRPGIFGSTGGSCESGAAAVDLSSRFQAQVGLSSPPEASFKAPPPPAAGPPPVTSAPTSGEGPPPTQPTSHRQAVRAAEQPGKVKLIKPDGFHSSASDKELQIRYCHTKILRDVGAPPTQAQLSGMGCLAAAYGGAGGAMAGGPPRYSGGAYGQVQQPSPQYLPPPRHHAQPFGAGGQQSYDQPFGSQIQQQQQPHNQYAPPPPAHGMQNTGTMNSGAGGQQPYLGNSIGHGALPNPGGYVAPPAPINGGVQPPPAPVAGPMQGGYSVFNPSADRVVAADSTSSAVL